MPEEIDADSKKRENTDVMPRFGGEGKQRRVNHLARFLRDTAHAPQNSRLGDTADPQKGLFKTMSLWGNEYGLRDVRKNTEPNTEFGREVPFGGWGGE